MYNVRHGTVYDRRVMVYAVSWTVYRPVRYGTVRYGVGYIVNGIYRAVDDIRFDMALYGVEYKGGGICRAVPVYGLIRHLSV